MSGEEKATDLMAALEASVKTAKAARQKRERTAGGECTCVPCTTPAYGAPGYAHCAACCYGTLIAEYDHNCPILEHREWAEKQFPSAVRIIEPGG